MVHPMPVAPQIAWPPVAQRLNVAQQPAAAHEQLFGSTNTEWQSVRASHAGRVVRSVHAQLSAPVAVPTRTPSVPPHETTLTFGGAVTVGGVTSRTVTAAVQLLDCVPLVAAGLCRSDPARRQARAPAGRSRAASRPAACR